MRRGGTSGCCRQRSGWRASGDAGRGGGPEVLWRDGRTRAVAHAGCYGGGDFRGVFPAGADGGGGAARSRRARWAASWPGNCREGLATQHQRPLPPKPGAQADAGNTSDAEVASDSHSHSGSHPDSHSNAVRPHALHPLPQPAPAASRRQVLQQPRVPRLGLGPGGEPEHPALEADAAPRDAARAGAEGLAARWTACRQLQRLDIHHGCWMPLEQVERVVAQANALRPTSSC